MAKAKAKTPYAVTLGRIGTREAHLGLRDLLEDGNDEGRIAAFQGLALISDPQDGILVHRYLLRPPVQVQKEASLILGKLKYRPSVPSLIRLLGQEDSGLQGNVLWALKEISGQAIGADPDLWQKWWEESQAGEKK
jgi:HEAT repeat protein